MGTGMMSKDTGPELRGAEAKPGGGLSSGWHSLAPTERAMVTATIIGSMAGLVAITLTGRIMPFLGWFAIVYATVFGALLKHETANAAWHVAKSNFGQGPVERKAFNVILCLNSAIWLLLIGLAVWYLTAERKLGLVMNPTQKEFVQIVDEFRKRHKAPYSDGDALFKARDDRLCKLSQAREPMARSGLARIDKRGFRVEIERQVFLKGSFSNHHPTSRQDLGSYNDGDEVIVTGWLNSSPRSCVAERSLTNAGAFGDPNFDFTFVEIRRL